jgi:predicted nucleotidyltransferase/uncharacterized protein (UPF0332 family)
MVKKKSTKKKSTKKKTNSKKSRVENTQTNIRTLNLKTDHEIAMDFATKAYKKYTKLVKSIILFGSVERQETKPGSDIDIIIVVDDVSLSWDQELIAWYREELDKIMQMNPYKGNIHINTIKLSSWWDGLMKGDPVILNVIRHGFAMIDEGGFFEPLKFLLIKGKIKGTPETIYQCLQRAPTHIARSKAAELAAIEGVYWSMVDSAQGALIAANYFPPSPEHIITDLKEAFIDKKVLKSKYLEWYKEIYVLHKKIDHKEIIDLKGIEIDLWQERAEEFMKVMINLVKKILE